MPTKPDQAFILAAGMGTRLRPYTDTMPKPMVDVGGQSIIKRTIDKLDQAGVCKIAINTHYLAEVLEDHLSSITKPEIIFSREESLLNTGGGIKKALHHLNDEPFYIINGDALWEDKGFPALNRLAQAWDDHTMDILILLQPVNKMALTHGVGDYHLDDDGKATRSKNKDGNYMFAGIRIASPRIFNETGDDAFSFLTLMDKAESQGRLYGIAHDGAWHHISTPEELEAVDHHLRKTTA